jgi:hypothetical protein
MLIIPFPPSSFPLLNLNLNLVSFPFLTAHPIPIPSSSHKTKTKTKTKTKSKTETETHALLPAHTRPFQPAPRVPDQAHDMPSTVTG